MSILIAVFAAIFLCLETGRLAALRWQHSPTENYGQETVENAVFALLGLMVAFTFSGAAGRFEVHRDLIVKEANTIGTAWLRLDLLPAEAQPALRQHFRDYLDARLAAYRALSTDSAEARAQFDRAAALQGRIWTEAVAACRSQDFPGATNLVLSSLNDMIDITTTRAVARQTHPPAAIYLALAFLTIGASILAGFHFARPAPPNAAYKFVFAATLALTIYLIVDLDYPRAGLIRIDRVDQTLVDVRRGMN